MTERERLAQIVVALSDGDPRPLIDHLEAGGVLDAEAQRNALLPYLRDWTRKPTDRQLINIAQRKREQEVCYDVWNRQIDYVLEHGKAWGSLAAAKEAHLKANPRLGPNSLDAYLRRFGGGVPSAALRSIFNAQRPKGFAVANSP